MYVQRMEPPKQSGLLSNLGSHCYYVYSSACVFTLVVTTLPNNGDLHLWSKLSNLGSHGYYVLTLVVVYLLWWWSLSKTIWILNKVFHTSGPNLVILAWTGHDVLARTSSWLTDTHRNTHTDDNTRRRKLALGKQGKSEGFESCDRPIVRKRPIWVKIGDVLSRVTFKFDRWPWKTIGHLFFAVSSFVHHFIAIGEFKLELQSGNAQFGSNSTIFRTIWPWNLTDDLEKQ